MNGYKILRQVEWTLFWSLFTISGWSILIFYTIINGRGPYGLFAIMLLATSFISIVNYLSVREKLDL